MYLEIDNISKSYGKQAVLKDISFQIEKGEFVCFLGPSGSGKTTLLNCLCGIVASSKGHMFLEGEDIALVPLQKRNFGIVFQHYALFPNLTAFENVAYGLHGMDKLSRKERVNEMLSLVGLKGYEKRFPSSLSGGQQQRVAIARALAPSPKLLLMDEPLSALDAQIRTKLGEDIRRLQKELSITTIMVTHSQQEAFALADRVVILNHGSIEQIGDPKSLYFHPQSQFVGEFLGDTNILCIDGRKFGIRYEDVQVREATEMTLAEPNSMSCRIEDVRHYGKFVRLLLLLQDMSTFLFADVETKTAIGMQLHRIMTATFPEDKKIYWQ